MHEYETQKVLRPYFGLILRMNKSTFCEFLY
jgi:hypothetical protein